MQYNESEYNGDSYDLTNYTSTLVETIAPTDATVTKSISALRTESQGTADTIGGSDTLQAFLETITILQRAKTPFAYNNGMYNQYMYNARLDEDEILLFTIKALSDSLGSSDFLQPFLIQKVLLETITDTATIALSFSTTFTDFIFFAEDLRVEITNKALFDTIRLNDWLEFKHRPFTEYWGG